MFESIEGKRGEPRFRPPFPGTKGLFGKPTVLNNVETLANIPPIFRNGAEWYRSIGTENSPGTKLFTVCGNVKKRGLTKSIEWGKGKTATLAQTNQKIVYAYPLSYGALTSIKDGNGFEGFGGYTRQTIQVGGQDYYVYVQNLPATASSKYTFA